MYNAHTHTNSIKTERKLMLQINNICQLSQYTVLVILTNPRIELTIWEQKPSAPPTSGMSAI